MLKTDCKVVEVIRNSHRTIRQLSVDHEGHRVSFTLFGFNLRALN
jgi:hypothetical protein